MNLQGRASEPSSSLQGRLLLAAPGLRGSCFNQAVILLDDHSLDSGATGRIINQRTGAKVAELVKEFAHSPLGGLAVYQGGPVGTRQLSFSAWGWSQEGRFFCLPRISPAKAEGMLDQSSYVVQATMGYSGWSPGQLESELEVDTWFTLGPSAELISQTLDHSLWKRLLTGISPYHALVSQAPQNPLLN